MKKIIFYLLVSGMMVACTKGNSGRENEAIPTYAGTYNDSKGDTAIVSTNGNYVIIDWRRSGGLAPFIFDSVVVNPDLTFTDNESVTIQWPLPNTTTFKNVGTGYFGTNTLNFTFIANGATIIYNGVKKN